MATLFEKKAEATVNPATHLLLVGQTKSGKTDYIADCALDGYVLLYVDNDNGLMTLSKRLSNNEEALRRVHYVKTNDIWNFLTAFFAREKFQWNETQDHYFSPSKAQPDDDIIEIFPKQIPFGVITVFDGWTTITNQLLQDSALKNSVPFETFNDSGQSVYGDAKRRADLVCMNIQGFPGHVIVQAHPEFYERMEKPKGVNNVKQNQMIIKDNIEIPLSVSRPHGYSMGKYFNEIGWMGIKATGDFTLDFRQKPDRIGGGSAMAIGNPKAEMRFSKLFDPPREIPDGWIRTVKAQGLIEEAAAEAERRKEEAAERARLAAEAKAASKPKQPALPAAGAIGTTSSSGIFGKK